MKKGNKKIYKEKRRCLTVGDNLTSFFYPKDQELIWLQLKSLYLGASTFSLEDQHLSKESHNNENKG